MESLLGLFAVLAAAAVVAQLLIMVGIYLNYKKLREQFDRFMKETGDVMVPVRSITENLRVASTNMVEISVAAREQFQRVETLVAETGDALHVQLDRLDMVSREVANRINETATVVQDSVVKPFREVSALAKGISRGFEAFLFKRHRSTVDQAHQDEELFI